MTICHALVYKQQLDAIRRKVFVDKKITSGRNDFLLVLINLSLSTVSELLHVTE